jgi:hypothetical protein
MTFKWRAFTDALAVVEDVADVAKCFSAVPPELAQIGTDAYTAIINRDVPALTALVPRIQALAGSIQGDVADAGPAIDTLRAGVSQLVNDLTG